MTLQASGAISLANVQTEFGGSNPISISEYYAAAAGVPGSGTISLYDFYGKSAPGGGGPFLAYWSDNPRTLGTSFVYDAANTSNSFTGNTVTPGQQTQFTIYTDGGGINAGSATVRFYLAGSLHTTFNGDNFFITFTPVIGSSSIRFDSTLTDTDPYYGGGQGHDAPFALILARFVASGYGMGVEVYSHDFDYATGVNDPDYDD